MGQTTFANSRGIAHKGSGGMSIAFPDVCLTPAPPIPIPYSNIGKASDTSKGPKKVKTDKKMPKLDVKMWLGKQKKLALNIKEVILILAQQRQQTS